MGGHKVLVKGVSNWVLPELRRPLEELVAHQHVQRINPGRSFNRSGSGQRGMKPSIYDPTNHSLKISCQASSGSQEIFAVVPQEHVNEVRAYVQTLSNKYFS